MVSPRERSFIDQTVGYHASGGDLNALVNVSYNPDTSGVLISDAPTSRFGTTRLHEAARYGWCSAIDWLIQHGADVHLEASQGMTLLHAAVLYGHSDAAVLLLDAGARVDDHDWNCRTALHYAAIFPPKMCKLLLSRGASLDAARNSGGPDPEDIARTRGHTKTADLLAVVRAAGGWLP